MFEKLNFQKRIFIPFTVFVIAILSVSGIVFYLYTLTILEQNIVDAQNRTTQKLQEQMDDLLYEMDRIAIAANSSEYIMQLLKDVPNDPENNYFDIHLRENDAVKNALYSFISPRPIRGKISLITQHYDYTSLNNEIDNLIVSKNEIQNINWVEEALASSNYKFFLPPHLSNWSSKENMVFSVVRPLRDNYNIYGLIEVSRSIRDIDTICNSRSSEREVKAAIFNADRNLIYDNFLDATEMDKDILWNNIIDTSLSGNYTINDSASDSNFIASFSRLAQVDWVIVQFEDMETFRQPMQRLGNIILITYILVLLVLLSILYIFTRGITKPVRKLKDSLTTIDLNNLKLDLDFKNTNNEITLLGDVLVNLLSEVKSRTEKMAEYSSREMKAQLLALQLQLNPHFLYNTLSVIGAFGQKKGNTEVAQMCADLSSMLRYTISSGSHVTISSEVDHIENYLKLMSRRHGEFLAFYVNVDEHINEIAVPRLILQPIVENIFMHGFKNIEPPWIVRVEGYTENCQWRIKISDNATGFEPDAIMKLSKRIEEAKQGSTTLSISNDLEEGGLGLVNTFIRLHLYYNGKEFIDFFNSPEGGAVVIIGGPTEKPENRRFTPEHSERDVPENV